MRIARCGRLALALSGLCLGCTGVEKRPAASPEPDWAELAARRLPGLEPCRVGALPERLLCGSIEVPEDRSEPGGRLIPLNVVVVPAQSPEPPDNPVFVLEGGPGGAATRRAGGSIFAGPVRARDIVLVDQRGTGRSNPLHCDLGGGLGEAPGELRDMFPPDDVRSCARSLAAEAELSLYTTEHFADDIEEVRRRLGYGPLNLRGGSYGTWAMMTFAQRHPRSTRSLFGIGMSSPSRSNLAERGVWAERTLRGLSEICAREPGCRALTPDLFGSVAALLKGLEAGPRRVAIDDPEEPASRLSLDLSRAWLAEKLRLVLYFGFMSRVLPWAVHRAEAAGDWQALVETAVVVERLFRSNLAYGVLLTVQCSELMEFDVEAALERGASTLIGSYRLEQQLEGCAAWPHERRPALGVETLAVLDTPAVFVSGALDPVTPPAFAEDATAVFPNSLHLVLPEGQHGPFDLTGGWECVHRIWAEFLDSADPGSLDTGCTAGMRRQPFLLDGEAFRAYLADELVPMIG